MMFTRDVNPLRALREIISDSNKIRNPFITGGIVEIPSYVVTWYAMDRLGRRWVLCLTMLLGGLACVSCVFVPEGTILSIFKSYFELKFLSKSKCNVIPTND